jgi:hypothetical protein
MVKSFIGGDLTRALFAVLDAGADADILLDLDRNDPKGAGHNVVAVVGGVVMTPWDLGVSRARIGARDLGDCRLKQRG